ncbi:MAG: hypothetical protein IKQ04_06010 [Oscillospiraceae bacterium]|nr:hypothetical protein [Oscillospiraceae bacterium]
MRKRMSLPILLLAAALLLSACGGAGSLPDEPYSPVEYKLYPAPEGAYVGDTMPFVTDEGTLELYYLYDTDHNGQGYHPIYKYSTTDFCGYTDEGMALNYGLMSEPDPALGTGSVMQDQNGLYHLFYTGHNDSGNSGRGKECVMHAVSTDRKSWEKRPEDSFFAPEGYSKDDFRDPEVFWVEEEQCYWLLIAARSNTLGGVVAKYTSKDLKNWSFEGPIYAPMAQYMLECPDLFQIGDTWYLSYSWDCVTYYAIGESRNGPLQAPEDNILDGKGMFDGNGFVFYAAKTAEFKGATYLCGWLGRTQRRLRHVPVGRQRGEPPAGAARGQDPGGYRPRQLCGLFHRGKGIQSGEEAGLREDQGQQHHPLRRGRQLRSGGHGHPQPQHEAGMRREPGRGRLRGLCLRRQPAGRDLYRPLPGRRARSAALRGLGNRGSGRL